MAAMAVTATGMARVCSMFVPVVTRGSLPVSRDDHLLVIHHRPTSFNTHGGYPGEPLRTAAHSLDAPYGAELHRIFMETGKARPTAQETLDHRMLRQYAALK
jgi:hypothetical protein